VGVSRGITERKHAAEMLQQSREMYRLLAENISDVIWIFDVDEDRTRYISPSVERLRGYTADEVMENNISMALTPAALQHVQNAMSSRIKEFQNGHQFSYVDELEQPCKDGSTVWVEVTTNIHVNEVNGHIEIYGVSRDITERRQLQEQDRNRIVLEERQHLARDLHDAVSQTLFSARVTSEMLLRQKKSITPRALWKNIAHFAVLVKSALGEMRILLLELRPEGLINTDLPILISHLVDAAASRTEAKINLDIKGRCELPIEAKIAFYRIAQESLNNIIKHAESTKIHISLLNEPAFVQLVIEDDGVGMRSSRSPGSQMGLSIMRERANEIGAILEITSVPRQGTRVTCTRKRMELK
jgi:PAS domain S-box-containing protein